MTQKSTGSETTHSGGPQECILILGMHRSGTSAVSRLIGLAYDGLPRQVLEATESNETGHWEPEPIRALNDSILEACDSNWEDALFLDVDKRLGAQQDQWTKKAQSALNEELSGRKTFVFKEPRVCRMVPFWRRIIADAGAGIRVVVPYRHPSEVAASLAKRDGLTLDYAHLLWLRHMLDAEFESRDFPRSFISYDGLLSDWKSVLSKVSKDIDRPSIHAISVLKDEVDQFISPTHRNHKTETVGALIDSELKGIIEEAHTLFQTLLETETPGKRTLKALDKMRDNIADAQTRFPWVLHAEAMEKAKRAALEDERTNTHKANLNVIAGQKELAEAQHQGRLAAAEFNKIIAETEHKFQQSQEQFTATINSIYASRSWRWSKPLRDGIDAYRKLPVPVRRSVATVANLRNIFRRNAVHHASLVGAGALPDHPEVAHVAEQAVQSGFILAAIKNVTPDNDGFVAIADPQFEFLLEKPARPGWYVLRLEMQLDHVDQASVYVDLGAGYSTASHLTVNMIDTVGGYEVRFFAPRALFRLRLDPMEFPGRISLKSLSLAPLSISAVIADGREELRTKGRRQIKRLARDFGGALVAGRPMTISGQNEGLVYQRWISRSDFNLEKHGADYHARVAKLKKTPQISVIMPVYNPPIDLVNAAIQSVVDQIYPYWELCIANDGSTEPEIEALLDSWAEKDRRIKVVHRDENGHISNATNSAFDLSSGEWIALLDHDDILRPHALAEVAVTLNTQPEAEVLYSDEDKISDDGSRFAPFFKSDWSIEMMRAMNYINHLTVHKAANIKAVGGWQVGLEGGQDYDLNLRISEIVPRTTIVHIPKILYHWRATAGSTATAITEKGYAQDKGLVALQAHLDRATPGANAEHIDGVPYYKVTYPVPSTPPLVSLVIPTRDNVALLKQTISSILQKSTYPNFEILIVDNNSEKPETQIYFDDIIIDKRVSVLPFPHEFNYSAINNFAVAQAKGEIIGLVNNDIEVITPEWLDEMVSLAIQPGVGCVGAKLYYPDDTIQHGGVVLGIGGVAQHVHSHEPRTTLGYFSRMRVRHNLSAVTAACLVVRKEVFDKVGGLDEEHLKVAFNDIDFCLKVREQGLWNVWTPFAELYHHESASRGADTHGEKYERFMRENNTMFDRWGDELANDPFYNPNLRRDIPTFSPRQD